MCISNMSAHYQPNVVILYNSLKTGSVNGHKNFAILKVVFDNENLKTEYENRIVNHNNMFMTNPLHDSGFDVLVPTETGFQQPFVTQFIDMKIKTEMFYCEVDTDRISTCAFNVHPRSSISKTPLMLANHTGIIDSGYRGSLIGAFRMLPVANSGQYVVEKNARLLQICHPSLCPIYVVYTSADDLSGSVRGEGGFGSSV
jgi:dUTP pyrophosphatase